MQDRSESTPSHLAWEARPAFREIFRRLFNADDAATLDRLGDMLYDLRLEAKARAPRVSGSSTEDEMQAVLADLQTAQSFLLFVGREHLESELAPADVELSVLAAEMAAAVGRVVEAIAEGLS